VHDARGTLMTTIEGVVCDDAFTSARDAQVMSVGIIATE